MQNSIWLTKLHLYNFIKLFHQILRPSSSWYRVTMPRMRLLRKKIFGALILQYLQTVFIDFPPLLGQLQDLSQIQHTVVVSGSALDNLLLAHNNNLCVYPKGCPHLNILVPFKLCAGCLWMTMNDLWINILTGLSWLWMHG